MESLGKRYGGPDRIVGVDEATEAYLKLGSAERILKNQETESFEREMTQKEKIVIWEILKILPDFIKEYGAEQERFTSLDQVHILDDANPQIEQVKAFLERNAAGRYNPSSGRIEILPEGSSLLHLAHVLVHELMHANSFVSINLKNSVVSSRRFGISINEKGKPGELLFNFINEAVTEEMTKRFCDRYFPTIDLLREEVVAHKEKEDSVKLPDTPINNVLGELLDSQSIYGYVDERADFVALAQLLYEENKDKFDSYEDVFKLFATAMFKGDLLPIARLIEDTFGEGAFRKIGNSSKGRSSSAVETLFALHAGIEAKNKDQVE